MLIDHLAAGFALELAGKQMQECASSWTGVKFRSPRSAFGGQPESNQTDWRVSLGCVPCNFLWKLYRLEWGDMGPIAGRLKQLIDARKERGYVACEEISELLPEDDDIGRDLDDILSGLSNARIELFEEPKMDFELEAEGSARNSDDPVRVYLREVARVQLTRESEIELAKQIERGRKLNPPRCGSWNRICGW
jgi:hypothetical protein